MTSKKTIIPHRENDLTASGHSAISNLRRRTLLFYQVASSSNWSLHLFYLIVLIPGMIITIYYLFIASDQFNSEVKFVVRTIGISASISDGQGNTPSISSQSLNQDGHIVASFIESIELVTRLQNKIDLHSMFSNSDIDYFSRLKKDSTIEELYSFWKKQVSTYVDGPSGIIVLNIRAFSPNDSQKLANTAIEETRQLVDELSDRAKEDLISRSKIEVVKASKNYQKSLTELSSYQNSTGILDPVSSAELLGRLLSALISEKLSVEARLAVLNNSDNKNSPKKREFEELLNSLEIQIEKQQSAIAGGLEQTRPDVQKLSDALQVFSELETERLTSQAIYEAAQKNLNLANSAAIRRTTYLAVFSDATLPEKSTYPKRYSTSLLLIIAFMVVWGTILLLWASIQDHRN